MLFPYFPMVALYIVSDSLTIFWYSHVVGIDTEKKVVFNRFKEFFSLLRVMNKINK